MQCVCINMSDWLGSFCKYTQGFHRQRSNIGFTIFLINNRKSTSNQSFTYNGTSIEFADSGAGCVLWSVSCLTTPKVILLVPYCKVFAMSYLGWSAANSCFTFYTILLSYSMNSI